MKIRKRKIRRKNLTDLRRYLLIKQWEYLQNPSKELKQVVDQTRDIIEMEEENWNPL